MRHVLLVDTKITDEELARWQDEDKAFWKSVAGISPMYWTIRQDFTDYPTELDSDGDVRPKKTYVTTLTNDIHSKYHDFGTDFVMLLIHEDNWKSSGENFDKIRKRAGLDSKKGIWGTNWSYLYRNYHVQYCRWDKDNPANTFGTAYHERSHAFNALTATEIGVDIRPIVGVKNWDSGVTHGEEEPWEFIRHKENTEALKKIAPYLKLALSKRKKKHEDHLNGMRKTAIDLLNELVYLYRRKINQKDGVKK